MNARMASINASGHGPGRSVRVRPARAVLRPAYLLLALLRGLRLPAPPAA